MKQFAANSQGQQLDRFNFNKIQSDNFYQTIGGRTLLTQAIVAVGRDSFRMYIDPASRRLARVDDMRTGGFTTITYQSDRTDYMAFSAAGLYQSGVSLYQRNGEYFMADIVSSPGFQGQLDLTLGDVGAASLVAATNSGLANERKVDARIVEFMRPFQQVESLAKVSVTDSSVCGYVGLVGAAIVGTAFFVTPGTQAATPLGALLGATAGMASCALIQNSLRANPEIRDRIDRFFSGNLADDIVSFGNSLSATIAGGTSPALPAPTLQSTSDAQPVAMTALPAAPTSGPPAGNSSVTGIAVDRNNATYSLSGTVAQNGTLTASGGGVTINGQLSACTVASARFMEAFADQMAWADTGPNSDPQPRLLEEWAKASEAKAAGTCVNGSFNSPLGGGSVSGQTSPLGQCQTVTSSGGQGTFSHAYNMGRASGTATFTYDAFSIPDAFSVYNGGALVFSTGGLVSGSSSRSFVLNSASVFVTVSAPQDGTAWNFSLSCPT